MSADVPLFEEGFMRLLISDRDGRTKSPLNLVGLAAAGETG